MSWLRRLQTRAVAGELPAGEGLMTAFEFWPEYTQRTLGKRTNPIGEFPARIMLHFAEAYAAHVRAPATPDADERAARIRQRVLSFIHYHHVHSPNFDDSWNEPLAAIIREELEK